MDIIVIHNEQDYEAALARVETLMDAEPGSAEGDELEVQSMVIEKYEEANLLVGIPDPIAFLENVMEFLGHTQTDLANLLGSRPRASELLSRSRTLTLEQIRIISRGWNIPADPLIQEYPVHS